MAPLAKELIEQQSGVLLTATNTAAVVMRQPS
jgi:hypothetical protein